jgi:uncharacterized protein YegP (UPF0339 family)
MSKLVRSLALMTALAALSAGTVSVAQEKGKTQPTKAAKKAEKAEDKKGSIEVYKNDKGKWRYKIVDENSKTIAMPLPQASFESKDDVLKAIDVLKRILNEAKPVDTTDKK